MAARSQGIVVTRALAGGGSLSETCREQQGNHCWSISKLGMNRVRADHQPLVYTRQYCCLVPAGTALQLRGLHFMRGWSLAGSAMLAFNSAVPRTHSVQMPAIHNELKPALSGRLDVQAMES